MENRTPDTIETRKIAVLVDDGFDDEHVSEVKATLEEEGARVEIVSKVLGDKEGADGGTIEADESHATTGSILFDAIVVPGGSDSVDALVEQGDAKQFVAETFKHYKPIAALGEGTELLEAVDLPEIEVADDESDGAVSEAGIVTSRDDDIEETLEAFVDAVAEHRHWDREPMEVPA